MPRWPPASAISSASRAAASGASSGVEQLEREPARVVRLRLDREATGRGDELGPPGVARAVGDTVRPRLELAGAGERSARREQPRRAVQERRRDDAVVHGRIRPRRNPGLEPLAEVEPAVPQELLVRRGLGTRRSAIRMPRPGRRAGGVLDPLPHRRQPLAQSVEVAVVAPELPRHEHRGIPPPGGTRRHVLEHDPGRTVAGRIRDHRRHPAVGPLVGGEIVEPLRRERLDVVEHRRGVDEHLPVAGEAGALALRAVGRDVARVAAAGSARASSCRAFRRSSLEANVADRPKVAVHDDGTRGRGIPSRRNAVDLHVAEPVRRVPRLEDVARASAPR